MDFGFTSEQDELRRTVRKFAELEVADRSREMERAGRVPSDVLAGLGNLGVLGMNLPPDAGGMGASSVDLGVVVEELARADFSVAHVPIHHALGAHILTQASSEVRERWLEHVLAGSSTFAFSLTEPEAGSDAGAIRCRATLTDTGYVLNGEKTSISFLQSAEAVVVIAKVPNAPSRGITAFYVPLDLPGIKKGAFDDLGCRALGRGWLSLEEVEIPAAFRIGEEGQGFQLVMKIFDLTRTLIALAAVSTGIKSVELAADYAGQRRAFGVPIGAHQGVSFAIAEHMTKLQAARFTCYRALWLRDQGLPHTTEAAMSKWWGVVTAHEAIHAAMLIHGHSGYTADLPLEKNLRDVMGMEWGDGTANATKLVIARDYLGRDVVDGRTDRRTRSDA